MKVTLVPTLLLVLLCVLGAYGAEDISCTVTNAVNTDHRHRSPLVQVDVRIPGTWEVTGTRDTEQNLIYRTAFRLYNASNDVQLFPQDVSMTPEANLGGYVIAMVLNYPAHTIGTVQLQYTHLPHQKNGLLFNSTLVESLDLTCEPRYLNSIYGGVIVGGHVTIFASKPIKRCDSNTTSFLDASWFTYSSHSCDEDVNACTQFGQGSPCASPTGFIPMDAQRMIWYCPANTNFSTDLLYVDYAVTSGVVCDAADNHTVIHRGGGLGASTFTRITYGLDTDTTLMAYSVPNTDEVHTQVVVDLIYPIVYTNFTASKDYLALTHSGGLAVERCTHGAALSRTLVTFTCPAFKPWARVSPTWHLAGDPIVHTFPGDYGVTSTYAIDDELDDGLTGAFAHAYRLTEAYRLSAYQLLVRMSHVATALPDKDNLNVYLTSLYNASNVTRATASSFYLNYNEANKLPDDDDLYIYYFPQDTVTSNEAIPFSEAVSIENGPPDDTSDTTFDDLSSPWKELAYVGMASFGLVGLYVLNYAWQYYKGGHKYAKVRS